MRKFKGFNTVGTDFGNFKLYDVELSKRDLLNELYTRRGERLMSPTYGSIIWQLLFDPLYDAAIRAIKEDCIRIVSKDPRLELLETQVDENIDQQTITVTLVLKYLPDSTVSELIAKYNTSMASERLQG